MENLNEQLAQAHQLRKTNKLQAAEALYTTILEQHPGQLQALMELGQVYRHLLKPDTAITYFKTAIALHPNGLWPHIALSEALLDKRDFADALTILDTIEKKYPNHYEIVLRRGYVYRAQGKHEQALRCLQQSLQLNPNHTNDLQLHLELAIALRDQNQLEASLAEFNFLQQNHPPNSSILFHLAQLYRRQGNHAQALIYLKKATAIDSNNIYGHTAIIEVLRESQQFDAAWEKIIELEQRYPQRFEIWFQKGLLYRLQNNSDLSLTCFQQAVALNANDLWSQIAVAEELRNQGQFAQALTILEALETSSAPSLHVLMQKGYLYRAQNQHQQALVYFQQAYAQDNSNINALLEIANEKFKLGEVNTAIESLMQSLKQQPTDLNTLLQIGNWLNIANAKEQALSYFQQALTAHPKHIQSYLLTAQLLYDLGRTAEALNFFQQAIEQCGERAEIYLNKAQILWSMRDLDAAWQCLNQGLNLFPDNYWLQIKRIDFLIQTGQFGAAQQFINICPADMLDKKIQLQTFSAQLAERQWQLDTAMEIYQAIIKQYVNHLPAHDALRRLYMLKLDFEQAKHHALMTTRYRLSEQKINGQTGRGHLHDHVAQMTDEYSINQPILEQVKQATALSSQHQKLNVLASLIVQEPESNAVANTFLLELRQQNYFTLGVPKRIFQYWDKSTPPNEILAYIKSWIQHNPDYSHQLFNDQTARKFLRDHYAPKVLMAYSQAMHAAQKADILRLALLYEYGGIYVDADDVCLKPLAQWLPKDIKILFYQEEYATVGNNFIACIAKHPVIKQAIDYAIESLLHIDKSSIWLATGPAMVSRALALYLGQNWSQKTPKELGVVVMTREELMQVVGIHGQLAYKRTNHSWLMKEFKSGKKLDLTQLIKTNN